MADVKVTDADRAKARGYLSGAFDEETPVDIIARAHAEGFAAGVAQERERCAKVAEDYDGPGVSKHGQYTQLGDGGQTMRDIAAAIRAGEVRG